MYKFDNNLCNESWLEMEIANIQIALADVDCTSEEHDELSRKLDDYISSVIRIEGAKREKELIFSKYVECGTKIVCASIIAGAIFSVARRLIK